jgi:hypothetical protein
VRSPLLVLLAFVGGCTVLSSRSPLELKQDSRPPEGVHYSLPRGYVDVDLHADPDTRVFTIAVSDAKFSADPEHQYFLQYRPLPNYDDNITIETTSSSFLKKVYSTTDDKSDDIVVDIAGAFGALGDFELAELPPGSRLIRVPLDPARPEQIVIAQWALNDALLDHARTQVSVCNGVVSSASGSLDALRRQTAENAVKLAVLADGKKAALAAVTAAEKAFLEETDLEKKKVKKEDLIKKRMNLREVEVKLAAADAAVKAAEQNTVGAEAAAKPTRACNDYQSIYRRTIIGLVGACRRGVPTQELQGRCGHYEKELVARKLQRDPSLSRQWLLLRLEVEVPAPVANIKHADCSVGICYRLKEPYVISYWMDNERYSKLVELPNKSPLVSIDIQRAFLVKKVQEIDFDESGFLNKIKIEKESELAAAAALPLAVITAIADAIPFQTKLYTQKKNLLEKEAALAQARARLRATGANTESGRLGPGSRPENAPLTGGPPRRRAGTSSSLGTSER